MRLTTAERKEQIIHQAIRIIHEQGFPALSIRELAARVGISEPAIYRHFTSKEEIILGILDKMLELGEFIRQKMTTGSDELAQLRQFILLQLAYFEKNQEMTTIMLSEEVFHLNERLKHRLAWIIQSRVRLLTNLIQSAQSKNLMIPGNVENLTAIVMGTLRVTIFQWKLADYQFSLVERGKSIVDTLMGLIQRA